MSPPFVVVRPSRTFSCLPVAKKPNLPHLPNDLESLGDVYYKEESSKYKIRVGVFATREEAERALIAAKGKYKGAFIVKEDGQEFQARGVATNLAPSAAGKYKVQLAAYRDSRWFDETLVSELGIIEERPKGDLTVKYLSGFDNLAEAKTALVKAKSAGFDTAYIVEETSGGALRKID